MDKLFIIEYCDQGTSWYWAKNKEEAKKQALETDEATEYALEEAEIWCIDEAINKQELKERLDRYINKPLNK